MRSEAACLTESSNSSPNAFDLVSCAGGSPGRAYAEAGELLTGGATHLISFGIGGALDPEIRPGDIVMPSHVTDASNETYDVDIGWRDALRNRYDASLSIHTGTLMTSETPVAAVPEKQSLRRRTGASMVDMESAGVAAKAAAEKIPFIAIRAAADPAERPLPRSALVGLRPDGTTNPMAVIGRLLLNPWDLPGLIRLGSDSGRALRALRRVASIGF